MPPVLMLPSREQDYTDPYFRAIFPKAVRLMRESTILVIVGYSLPEEDALIRFILRQFAEEQEDALGKYIFYIDYMDDDTKRSRLEKVFPWIRPNAFPCIALYQGGFEKFAEECVCLARARRAKPPRKTSPKQIADEAREEARLLPYGWVAPWKMIE